jgi:acetyltransferase-like isoleucine patch superfamily enzyme
LLYKVTKFFNSFQKICFRLRGMPNALFGLINISYYRLLGMGVGKSTMISKVVVNWPHQVTIGRGCAFEEGVCFTFSDVWKPGPNIKIGDFCFLGRGCEFNIRMGIEVGDHSLIAAGCRFIDHDHGLNRDELMCLQLGREAPIVIGSNVWIGANAIILRGVTIHSGAVVGAGAVVTKSIPANEIWGGVPARKIALRA